MALKVLPPWGRPLPNSTSGSALRTNFLLRAAYGCLRARGAWLVNQSIGFGALHCPINASTVAWGSVIGAAALVANAASAAALRAVPLNRTPLVLALALICAYGAYELALFAAPPFLGGGAFTIAIAARLGLLNLAWLIGLVVARDIFRLLSPFGRGRAVRLEDRASQETPQRPAATVTTVLKSQHGWQLRRGECAGAAS